MFWLRLFNSMAAAIPTMLAGGEDFFDLIGCAAACKMASKVGALVLSSVMTSSHLKSVILFSEDTRSTEGTGLSRQSEPHSTLMIWRMIYSHSIVLNMYSDCEVSQIPPNELYSPYVSEDTSLERSYTARNSKGKNKFTKSVYGEQRM